MLGSGVGMMIGFLFLESRLKTPIIDVRLIMNRSFVGYSVAGLMANRTGDADRLPDHLQGPDDSGVFGLRCRLVLPVPQ